MSVLLDAGPTLNFLAVGQQHVLLQAAASLGASLAVPENVDREVKRQVKLPQFASTPAHSTWTKLRVAGHIQVLSDELETQVFAAAIERVSGKPKKERMKDQKSLGEIVVIAHASVLVQQGTDVHILMDDQDGCLRARKEMRWLRELPAPARLRLMSTRQLLEQAQSQIVGGLTWQQVYDKMRPYDRALAPLT